MSFLNETVDAIYDAWKNSGDVVFIGSPITGHRCTWSQFEAMADFDYDKSHRLQKIAHDLVIVFSDTSRLIRVNHDGHEKWLHAHPAKITDTVHPISTLARTDSDYDYKVKTLAELNQANPKPDFSAPKSIPGFRLRFAFRSLLGAIISAPLANRRCPKRV